MLPQRKPLLMDQLNNAKRIEELIAELGLQIHPEGGYYIETYRSEISQDINGRSLATSIYFLLTHKNPSNFHRISSDELWFFHEGSSLQIHTLDQRGHTILPLGSNLKNAERPYHLVKGGTIFGSSVESEGGYALVSCVVAPGFDFNDFHLFTTEELLVKYPDHRDIIERLT